MPSNMSLTDMDSNWPSQAQSGFISSLPLSSVHYDELHVEQAFETTAEQFLNECTENGDAISPKTCNIFS